MQPLLSISASDLQSFLDNPEQLRLQSVELQLAIASFIDTPSSLLEILTQSADDKVAQAARLHVNYAGEITDNIEQLVDEILSTQQMGQNDRLAVELLKLGAVPPCFLSEWVPSSQLIQALRNPQMPLRYRLQLLERLAKETSLEPKLQVAESPETPLPVLSQLAGDLELPVRDRNAKLTAARSHKTPIYVLEQLAKDADEMVRRVVSEDSNSPLQTLLELARDVNINIRLNLLYKSSHKKMETPIQLLEILAQDESEQVRAKVAEHRDITIELLTRLANDTSREVKHAVAKNIKTPVDILEKLSLEENIFAVRNPNTPESVLTRAISQITGYKSIETLRNLIKESGWTKGTQMSAKVLDELSYHSDSGVRMEVASHTNTSTKTLERLSNDKNLYVRLEVAQHPNTPPHALEQIVRYKDTDIDDDYYYTLCSHLSRRPDTPDGALEFFSYSQRTDIRNLVAGYSNTSIKTFARMVLSETNEFVLETLAHNRKLTPDLLLTLAQKPYLSVRKEVIKHPNITSELWEQLARDEVVELREAIASQYNCPDTILEQLARDENEKVRATVANNFKTPVSILEILAGDVSSNVRTIIASSRKLSEAILTQLAADEKVEVRRAVAENPNTPLSIRNNLRDLIVKPKQKQKISPTLRSLSRLYNPSTDDLPTILTEYSQSENGFVRFITLMNPQTPLEILSQAINSSSWLERYAVAENSAISEEIRQSLVKDSNRIVRATALQNL